MKTRTLSQLEVAITDSLVSLEEEFGVRSTTRFAYRLDCSGGAGHGFRKKFFQDWKKFFTVNLPSTSPAAEVLGKGDNWKRELRSNGFFGKSLNSADSLPNVGQ